MESNRDVSTTGDDVETAPAHGEWPRRDVVIGGTVLVAGLASGLVDVPEAEAAKPPERQYAQAGDRIQFIKGTLKDKFLKPDMLEVGGRPVEAFPYATDDNILRRRNRLNRLLVVRLDPSEMDDETRARSADGVLVYSALCTHRACTIKSWMADERYMRCHCHLSQFAALSGGSVKSGPARRSLPMVPITLDEEGYVVATDGFSGKVGAAKK